MLTLSAAGALSVVPFAVIRFSGGQMLVGSVDLILIMGVSLIGLYGWWTRQVRFASMVMTLFFMTGLVIIINLLGASLIYWAYPTMVAAFFLVKPREAAAINLLVMVLVVPVLVPELPTMQFIIVLVTLLLNNVFAYVFATRMNEHREHLSYLAERDPLTGIGNRRALIARLEDVLTRQHTKIVTASLVVLDMDHFKDVNDTYGHTAGDKVLCNVAQLLLSCAKRRSDYCYRLGGDEFALILVGLDADSAKNMINAGLEKNLSRFPMLTKYNVAFSYGATELKPEDTYQQFLHRADSLMYQSKRAKNQRTRNFIPQEVSKHFQTKASVQ